MLKFKYTGNHRIEVYDSVQDLPITRFQLYNLNMLLDAGIGSDLSAFVRHRQKISELMKTDLEAANIELVNLEQTIRFMMSKTNPEMNSFVVMIKTLNGRDLTDADMTEDGIKEIIKELGGNRFSLRNMRGLLETIKKKLDFEFETFFPVMTDDSKVKEFYSKLKKRSRLLLKKWIEKRDDVTEEIKKIDEFLIMSFKPKIYHGSQGVEVKMIKNFEDTCTMLELHNLTTDPKRLTTLSFYQKVETMKQILKQQKKKNKKSK